MPLILQGHLVGIFWLVRSVVGMFFFFWRNVLEVYQGELIPFVLNLLQIFWEEKPDLVCKS